MDGVKASKGMVVTGWVISVLPVLLMIASAMAKFFMSADTEKGFAELGWTKDQAVMLGVIELSCVAIYLIPGTAVLGAILMTGYLGGAVATHLRVGQAVFFMPALVGVFVWLGLFLREPRLWKLVPWRR